MPVMGGLEATSAIRVKENGSGKRIPIIALTAHAMQGDAKICKDAGMDGYLTTPYGYDDLKRVLAQYGHHA